MPRSIPNEWKTLFGNDSLSHRPALAAYIGEVVGAWAHCEMQLGKFLAELCSNDPRAALAILDRFGTLTARVQAVQSVASALLPEEQFKDIKSLLRRYESVGKDRNKIIHGLWGISDQAQESLIRCPPDSHIGMSRSFNENLIKGRPHEALEELRTSWEVWGKSDFERVLINTRRLMLDFLAVSHAIDLERLSAGQINYQSSLAKIRSTQPD